MKVGLILQSEIKSIRGKDILRLTRSRKCNFSLRMRPAANYGKEIVSRKEISRVAKNKREDVACT